MRVSTAINPIDNEVSPLPNPASNILIQMPTSKELIKSSIDMDKLDLKDITYVLNERVKYLPIKKDIHIRIYIDDENITFKNSFKHLLVIKDYIKEVNIVSGKKHILNEIENTITEELFPKIRLLKHNNLGNIANLSDYLIINKFMQDYNSANLEKELFVILSQDGIFQSLANLDRVFVYRDTSCSKPIFNFLHKYDIYERGYTSQNLDNIKLLFGTVFFDALNYLYGICGKFNLPDDLNTKDFNFIRHSQPNVIYYEDRILPIKLILLVLATPIVDKYKLILLNIYGIYMNRHMLKLIKSNYEEFIKTLKAYLSDYKDDIKYAFNIDNLNYIESRLISGLELEDTITIHQM